MCVREREGLKGGVGGGKGIRRREETVAEEREQTGTDGGSRGGSGERRGEGESGERVGNRIGRDSGVGRVG